MNPEYSGRMMRRYLCRERPLSASPLDLKTREGYRCVPRRRRRGRVGPAHADVPDQEAVRLALDGVAVAVACDGCPPVAALTERYASAGGRYFVCPICFDAKRLDKGGLIVQAEIAGTVPMWDWIGDDGATTFSYWPPCDLCAGPDRVA